MLWEDKVEEWRADEVTKAFFADVSRDIEGLTNTLVEEDKAETIMRLQGMLRALKGVLGMPEDGITPPAKWRE